MTGNEFIAEKGTPAPTASWEEEFDERFNWATFCWNGDNTTGERFAKHQKAKVKSFIRKAIEQERADAYKKAIVVEHLDSFEAGKRETLQEVIEMIKEEQSKRHDGKVNVILSSLITALEAKQKEI